MTSPTTDTTTILIILKAGGERRVVSVEDAAAIRARFESELAGGGVSGTAPVACHCLDLSGLAWRVESLRVLTPLFRTVAPTLRTLLVDDIVASLPTEDGLATLEFVAQSFGYANNNTNNNNTTDTINTNTNTTPLLTTVNLNDNAIGTRGIAVLQPLLQHPTVTSWYFQNTGIAQHDAITLRDLFRHNSAASASSSVANDVSAYSNLESLHTGRNRFNAGGAIAIGKLLSVCPNLQSFSHFGTSPQAAGSIALCQGLAQMTQLSLQLDTTTGCKSTRLVDLDLTDLSLKRDDDDDDDTSKDDPVGNLCTVIEHARGLQTLKLRDSGLQLCGLRRVVAALQSSAAALTTLDFSTLEEEGDDAATIGTVVADYLVASPTRRTLLHLYVDLNELGDAGVAAVAAGAAACTALQTLSLENNEMTDVGAWALRHNVIPTLQTLALMDNAELSANAARQLQSLYPTVTVDEDLEELDEEDDDDNDAVDDLANALNASHL